MITLIGHFVRARTVQRCTLVTPYRRQSAYERCVVFEAGRHATVKDRRDLCQLLGGSIFRPTNFGTITFLPVTTPPDDHSTNKVQP